MEVSFLSMFITIIVRHLFKLKNIPVILSNYFSTNTYFLYYVYYSGFLNLLGKFNLSSIQNYYLNCYLNFYKDFHSFL
jgi:hypothetical protein